MRICYLTYSIDPNKGIGKFSSRLIKTVKEKNPDWDITILTTQKTGDLKEEIPLISSNKYKLLFNLTKIRSAVKKCDLIHALDGFPYGIVASVANIGLGKKLFITGIGTGAVRALYNPIYSWPLKWAYKKADKVFTISDYTAREINKVIPEVKIKTITPGVDFNDFCQKDLGSLSQKIVEKKPYILTVGTMKERKGYHISLPAFAQVIKKIPNLNYVIVGNPKKDPKYFSRLKKIIKELGIEKRVFIIRRVETGFLRKLYNNAELFCLMSQDIDKDIEGFGLVFLEAAASGLPIVASKDTGAEDAVLDRQNGFLVDQKDVLASSDNILRILNDRKLKRKFSERSIEFAKESSWESKTVKYIQHYKSLFNKDLA